MGVGTSNPQGLLDVGPTFYTAQGTLILRPQNGSVEGGELELAGAGSKPMWIIDNFDTKLRLFSYNASTDNTTQVQIFNPSGAAGLSVQGNVGIGTWNPVTSLQVNGGVLLGSGASSITPGFNGEFGDALVGNSGGFRVNRNSANEGTKVFSSFHSNSGVEFYHEVLSGTASRFVFNGGSVGIGTTGPTHLFEVAGRAKASSWSVASSSADLFNNAPWYGIGVSNVVLPGRESNAVQLAGYYGLTFAQGGATVMALNNNNVGIGTTSPTHKLSVNGTIKAKEVIVETTGWSDYVFADDYRLAPLSEVEAHIKTERRLPGIPSEEQVAEQGVSIGEMQAALLAKIEEVTLHLIRIEKENTALRAEVEALKRAAGESK